MKLLIKRRDGSHIYRRYDRAQTPLQRLLACDVLDEASRERLSTLYAALDLVRLLRQLQMLQEALWRHAVVNLPVSPGPTERFNVTACGLSNDEREQADVLSGMASTSHTRKYHRTAKSLGPRTYRTRKDPFEGEWDEIQSWLASAPERTAKSIFLELQQRWSSRKGPWPWSPKARAHAGEVRCG